VLKILLDEHISPAVAAGLRRSHPVLIVQNLAEWENGHLLGQDDSTCLQRAAGQGLTLVTYDRRTIPPLLKSWAEAGRDHGGVIFMDEKTISPANIGSQVRELSQVVKVASHWDWTSRIWFLER